MTDHDADKPDGPYIRVGAFIAGYRLEERIGSGGMAVVYRAHDRRLDRPVALKILAPQLALDNAFRERFIRESRAAAAVDDPHIIPVFQAGEAAGVLFIAMRYVRGGDVRSLIDRTGPLPPGRVADMVTQVAAALDAAHARGLVHRDVKPANMLLETRPGGDLPDHLYLSDFGLTKASIGTSLALTASGEFMGTLEYVSPEQIEGGQLDGRTDEYSLACSAYEMLCGQPPFRREQGLSVMFAHVHEPPPSILERRPDLPAGVETVLVRALAKAAADRYASCGEFATALRQALAAATAGPPWADAPRPAAQPTLSPVRGSVATESPGATRQYNDPGHPAEMSRTEPSDLRAPTPPGLTEPAEAPPGPPGNPMQIGSPAGRQWWRSPARVAGVGVLALALAGGGIALATRGSPAGRGHHAATTLSPPACTRAVAKAPRLTSVGTTSLTVPGPFGVAVSGNYAFVSGGDAVTVLRTDGTAVTQVARFSVPGAIKGDAITHDGRYLLAATGGGAAVISIKAALSGAPDPVVGTLNNLGGAGAAEVVLSPDDRYAFVTVQSSAELAVFNLQVALTQGFGTSDFVGDLRVGSNPVGLAAAGDALYVANEGGTALSILSMSAAEKDLPSAVVAAVPAGCGPARLLVSGNVLWVTAEGSNALLGFSTERLRNDRAHALIATVPVGAQPLGLAMTASGSRMLVADSDQSVNGASSNLAVIDTARALSGKAGAVLGYIATGTLSRQIAVAPGGRIALVTVTSSGQVQVVNLGELP